MAAKNKRDKRPRAGSNPSAARVPRAGAAVEGKRRPVRGAEVDGDPTMVWRFSHVDLGGPWGWSRLATSALGDLQQRLVGWEAMKESEVFVATSKGGNKLIPIDHLCDAAKQRLLQLKLDDQDGLWELRMSGAVRIWGLRAGHVFYFLWWDPEHTVCPGKR